ncbi:efflux transporter outer membrane subunit [Parasedimentitalea maritima]|uniref:Efflux transporter outer membrane subunit n=1 Tax=Parasedimentitalea maritima TaxID=2578117 RepID=A0ABY2UTF0_9RHOB|nr:efflux transporter outer membrane subunit [Zongyanglinia marina]
MFFYRSENPLVEVACTLPPTEDDTEALPSRRMFFSGLGATALLGSGCSVGEDFESPSTSLPNQYFHTREKDAQSRGAAEWWKKFNDPSLNRLVELGLAQNLDVQKAVERIEQSRAILSGAGYPISGASRIGEAKVTGGGTDGRADSGFVRAEASWQLDLYGQLKREREAASYRLASAFADANVARTTLLDELVTAYIDLRFYQELIRVNQRVVASREETLQATQTAQSQTAQSGDEAADEDTTEVTELDVAQAKSLVATAKAELPEATILFFKSASRIGRLLGQAWERPRGGLDKKAPQPGPDTTGLKVGIPADLVRNRPDVLFAENRLAEAVALAGVAEAELYPRLQLTGNLNVNYSSSDWLPTAGFFRVGLDVPLFDLPERRAKVAAQQARAAELLLEWKERVVEAVEEVQNALVSLKFHKDAVAATHDALDAKRDVLKLAREGYIAGDIGFLQVLDAERSLLSNENALALDRRNFAVDFVQLNVALGGSYG